MSDKLQEIKASIGKKTTTIVGQSIPSIVKFIHDTEWLIEQLEKAQTIIEEQKSNYSDLEDELERINNHLFDACKQFEQAQEENYDLSSKISAEKEMQEATLDKFIECEENLKSVSSSYKEIKATNIKLVDQLEQAQQEKQELNEQCKMMLSTFLDIQAESNDEESVYIASRVIQTIKELQHGTSKGELLNSKNGGIHAPIATAGGER